MNIKRLMVLTSVLFTLFVVGQNAFANDLYFIKKITPLFIEKNKNFDELQYLKLNTVIINNSWEVNDIEKRMLDLSESLNYCSIHIEEIKIFNASTDMNIISEEQIRKNIAPIFLKKELVSDRFPVLLYTDSNEGRPAKAYPRYSYFYEDFESGHPEHIFSLDVVTFPKHNQEIRNNPIVEEHELGHILGLTGHSGWKSSAMYGHGDIFHKDECEIMRASLSIPNNYDAMMKEVQDLKVKINKDFKKIHPMYGPIVSFEDKNIIENMFNLANRFVIELPVSSVRNRLDYRLESIMDQLNINSIMVAFLLYNDIPKIKFLTSAGISLDLKLTSNFNIEESSINGLKQSVLNFLEM